jgi:divalent metal cation (Fe/Co/Zn/Cd) transporter
LLLVVAAFIVIASSLTLLGYGEPRPSYVVIVLLALAAIEMPWLAARKRKLAIELSSASLKADAAESSLCGYMSWIALGDYLPTHSSGNHGQIHSLPWCLSHSP